jgi:hypothetical protein
MNNLQKFLNGTIEKVKTGYCVRVYENQEVKIFKNFNEAYNYLQNRG